MKLTITKQFQKYLTTIHINLASILEEAEIPNKLWQEELQLDILEYYRLLQVFDTRLSEQEIRDLSRIEEIQLFMPSFFAALSAKNGQEAIQRFAKFKKIVGPIMMDVIESEQTIAIIYKFTYENMPLSKFSVLNEQLLIVNLLRVGSGKDIKPLIVDSPFQYDKESLEALGVFVQKSPLNRIVFNKNDVLIPFVTENNAMWPYLEPELNQQLARQDTNQTMTNFVQRELYRSLPSGEFSIDSIASKLGMSTRTLQRNLSGEGTSFKEELQAVQKAMVFSYMKLKVSTDEIAELVGYSEVNALSRAFKKWTGMTMKEYKKQLD